MPDSAMSIKLAFALLAAVAFTATSEGWDARCSLDGESCLPGAAEPRGGANPRGNDGPLPVWSLGILGLLGLLVVLSWQLWAARKRNASLLLEEYTCSVCTEVFLDPVTLACGHTACRFCVQKWVASHRQELSCPVGACPGMSPTVPAVNVRMRCAIEASLGHIVERRRTELRADEAEFRASFATERLSEAEGVG